MAVANSNLQLDIGDPSRIPYDNDDIIKGFDYHKYVLKTTARASLQLGDIAIYDNSQTNKGAYAYSTTEAPGFLTELPHIVINPEIRRVTEVSSSNATARTFATGSDVALVPLACLVGQIVKVRIKSASAKSGAVYYGAPLCIDASSNNTTFVTLRTAVANRTVGMCVQAPTSSTSDTYLYMLVALGL